MPKLFIVVNEDRFFLSHRLDIAREAKRRGFDVTVVAKDTGKLGQILDMGFKTYDLPVDPTGMNIASEIKTFLFLLKLYRKEKPDLVHHVGLKTILWGALAAKFTKRPAVVDAVCGLGGLFNGPGDGLVTKAVLTVMRFSHHRKGVKVIFQNYEDMTLMLNRHSVSDSQVCFIKGSGVDLDEFAYTGDPDSGRIKVIFTARMVKEKGASDLIEAAEMLKPEYKDKVHFVLCGRMVPNASAISEEYLKEHCDGTYITWLGERDDIRDLLSESNIMAFPSYYREGLPKSLIEASAIGLPIITCNSVGCKDVVEDGVNGFLIEPRDVKSLAEKLKLLIDDRNLRVDMGKKAREKAERQFDINVVVKKHMDIYESVLKGIPMNDQETPN